MPDSEATKPSLLVRIRDERDSESRARFLEIHAPVIFQFARRPGTAKVPGMLDLAPLGWQNGRVGCVPG